MQHSVPKYRSSKTTNIKTWLIPCVLTSICKVLTALKSSRELPLVSGECRPVCDWIRGPIFPFWIHYAFLEGKRSWELSQVSSEIYNLRFIQVHTFLCKPMFFRMGMPLLKCQRAQISAISGDAPGGRHFLGTGYWGCAVGWGRIFTTGLTIMGLHFQ